MDPNFGTGGVACVPKKLLDFSDKYMLQLFDSEPFLVDHVVPRDRKAL
jgi:hypothetical protein